MNYYFSCQASIYLSHLISSSVYALFLKIGNVENIKDGSAAIEERREKPRKEYKTGKKGEDELKGIFK